MEQGIGGIVLKPIKEQYFKKGSGTKHNYHLALDDRGVSITDLIITIAAVIVIIISVVFLVINVANLNKINDEIDQIKLSIAEKQQALNQLIELGESEDKLKENYEKNQMFIPATRDEIGITSDITSIILDNDAIFRKITYDKEVEDVNGIIDIPFTVRAECTYDELTKIIDELGKTNRLYIIEAVSIVDSGAASTEDLSSDILIHAYYRKN